MFKVEEALAKLTNRFYDVDMSITFDIESSSIVTLFRGKDKATGLSMISRRLTHTTDAYKLSMDMEKAARDMLDIESPIKVDKGLVYV
jgi:hypothetical protein